MKTIKRFLSFGSALVIGLSSLFAINFGTASAVVIGGGGGSTDTWTGVACLSTQDCNWSTGNNWQGSVVPVSGDDLVFDNTSLSADQPVINDFTSFSFNSITFSGSGTHIFQVSGNPFTLTAGIGDTTSGSCNSSSCVSTIANDVTISGAQNFDLAFNTGLEIDGNLTGSGLITMSNGSPNSGSLVLTGDNSGFSGGIHNAQNVLTAESGTALGTGTTTIVNGGELWLEFDANTTFATPLVVGGTGTGTPPSINMTTKTSGGNGSVATWSGPITLTSNVTVFGSNSRVFKITGALSGNFTISPVESSVGGNGAVINNSSNNTSKTPSGSVPVTIAAGDNDSNAAETIDNGITYIIDGVRGDITVQSTGTLKGTGTVGVVDVQTGGTVAPGHSPGCLNTGNLTINGNYQAEIGGTTACTGYDQLNVSGTVDVTNGTLNTSFYNGYAPKAGEAYTIINNDGSDAVTGTFTGLPEGATFNVSGYVFQITYKGGDGNDVVLTVKSVPATPNTGFNLSKSSPLLTLTMTIFAAGGILAVSRRYSRQGK